MTYARYAPYRRFNPTRRSGIPDWRTTGFPAGAGIISTRVGLHPNAIDLHMEFQEGTIRPVRVQVQARRPDASESHFQYDASISRWIDVGTNPTIQGSVIALNPGEQWDILWTIAYDNGSFSRYLWPRQTTEAAVSLPDTAGLTPTRYWSPSGNDANAGTSLGAAWGTLDYAIDNTPANGILVLDNGFPTSSGSSSPVAHDRNSTITVIPLNKQIGDDGADLNNGNRVMVEPPFRTSPTGSGNPNAGVWSLVSVTGPGRYGNTAGVSYSLYKWTASGITNTTEMTGSWRTTRAGEPQRLYHHKTDFGAAPNDYLSTPGGFAEYLYTNQRFRWGFWVSPTGGDIYCRVPPDVDPTDPLDTGRDPNTCYTTFADGNSIGLYLKNGAGSRVSGIGFCGFGTSVRTSVPNVIVDHCWLTNANQYARFDSTDPILWHNRITDTCAKETPDFTTPDWGFVKLAGIMADGTAYGSKIGGGAESNIWLGTSQRLDAAHNFVSGTFNGFGSAGGNSSLAGQLYAWGANLHENVMQYIADDSFEPEQASMSWKIWGNQVLKSISFLSTGPVHGGPTYVFENQCWRMSANHVGAQLDGTVNVSGKAFSKFSSQSEPQSVIYVAHNTFWTDAVNRLSTLGAQFAGDSAGGVTSLGTKVHEKHWWYGNFIYCAANLMNEINETRSDEWFDDYNFYFTLAKDAGTGGPVGLKVGTVHYTGLTNRAMTDYRSVQKQGTHSNLVGATTYNLNDALGGTTVRTFFDAQLVAPTTANLALAALSPLRLIVPPCPVTARLGQSFYNVGFQP